MMDNEIGSRVSSVKSKLLLNYVIKVKHQWIEDCINFFISQAPDIDDNAIYEGAIEQFLLADAKEASNPVIPATVLQNKKPFTLNGTFVLQLQFLIDIGW